MATTNYRLLTAFLISIIIAIKVYMYHRRTIAAKNSIEFFPYMPIISGYYLPALILFIFLILLMRSDFQTTSRQMLDMWFGNFLHLGIYYIFLMFLLPILRKYISAKSCATLWILPNFLYLAQHSIMELPRPLLVLHAPIHLIWILFYIWMAGFAAILIWNIVSHLLCRQKILQDSIPVTDEAILALLKKEIDHVGIQKPKFKLVLSKNVSTPISIGLFQWSIRVVLPAVSYTDEELALIFRHELVHIGREDAWTKFFLMFCTAMLWFNPIMWISRLKCSEDLELSCDEIVLHGSDDAERRLYANLILNTAGEQRGFTTCLSSTAESMRYRLKHIVKPKRNFSGALVVGGIFFLLMITNNYISLAYTNSTGFQSIFQSRQAENFELSHITVSDSPYQTEYHCEDTDALYHYLSDLVMEEITGTYSFEESERKLTIIYDSPEGVLSMILYDEAVKVVPIYKPSTGTKYYYLPNGTDWDYLDSIIEAYPALNIQVHVSGNTYSRGIGASLWNLKRTKGGSTEQIYQETHLEATPSGMIGYEANEAILDFSYPPIQDFSVTVENWERTSSYTTLSSSFEQPMVLPLASFPAHYTITASFQRPDGAVFDAEFRFDFGHPDTNLSSSDN